MTPETTNLGSGKSAKTEPTPMAGSFAALFEESLQSGEFKKEGEIVIGTVVAVTKDQIVIDIGGKSEGMIASEEFEDAQGQVTIKAGDKVDVSPRSTHS